MKTLLRYASIILSLNLVFSCEDCDTVKNCVDQVLEIKGMVKYDQQELGCSTFLELYKFNGRQYFYLRNHCADMITYPFDCSGNQLCEIGENQNCIDFYETAEYIGIVGIKIN